MIVSVEISVYDGSFTCLDISYFDCDISDCSPSLELLKFHYQNNDTISYYLNYFESIPRLFYGSEENDIRISQRVENQVVHITIQRLEIIKTIFLYRQLQTTQN